MFHPLQLIYKHKLVVKSNILLLVNVNSFWNVMKSLDEIDTKGRFILSSGGTKNWVIMVIRSQCEISCDKHLTKLLGFIFKLYINIIM